LICEHWQEERYSEGREYAVVRRHGDAKGSVGRLLGEDAARPIMAFRSLVSGFGEV
jgi:hypothetical protein